MSKKSQFSGGRLSKPGSQASMEWLESVRTTTPWLADIVLEDWRARGVEFELSAKRTEGVQNLDGRPN
jgi:hypothetical protein